MEADSRKAICNPIDRYQTLRLKESLSTPFQYILACKELSFILKNAYSKFPKNLQSLIFQDTLFAFSLLPEMQTQSAILAANSLLQSAEFALPKQKRATAVTEHKHAVVTSKRKIKAKQEEEGIIPLPQDVLMHVFSFLDMQSLVSASAVCRSWNVAASDNHLWEFLYAIYFCGSGNVCQNGIATGVGIDWRCAFKIAYKGFIYCFILRVLGCLVMGIGKASTCYRKFKSYRGYCSSCCSVVWLSSNRCANKSNIKDASNHQIKPISRQQIVEFILDGFLVSESSSDSDSDPEDVSMLKLWAYPRQIG
ncbi:F-box protein [Sesamum angolense]|uniref:F-box protein n=1 Tax=Sesamum angolense TaxID=2727404 RepID=A0AAE1W1G2_9LAMI|nr:F-box protein [Sesamum angolense]